MTTRRTPTDAMSRRALVGAAAMAAFAGRRASAAADAVLKVGFVSPRTGALAGFGQTDGYVLDLARKALAKGLTVAGRTYAIVIIDRDTQSDPSRASQLAKALINRDQVDLMLAVSTPATINPVANACEAAGVPCLSTAMPWQARYVGRGAKPGQPSPFNWTYHFGFGLGEFGATYVSQWSLIPTNKRVGVLYPNDAEGNNIRANLLPLLAQQGFTIVDPGPYEEGTTDYSAAIALFKREHCQIFNSFPIPADFAAFWRQATQQGYARQVRICQLAKTGLFPDDIQALGRIGYNIASAAHWHPAFPYVSPLTGLGSPALADGYEQASGKQWTQQLGATLSLLDAGFAALQASADPRSKPAVARALSTLNTSTIAGKVDFTSGPVPNVATGPIVGTQWVKSKPGSTFKLDYVVTEHATDPNVPVQAKLLAYSG